MSDPIIWIWTALYTYQINWKNAANLCKYASEIVGFISMNEPVFSKVAGCKPATSLNWAPSEVFSRVLLNM